MVDLLISEFDSIVISPHTINLMDISTNTTKLKTAISLVLPEPIVPNLSLLDTLTAADSKLFIL